MRRMATLCLLTAAWAVGIQASGTSVSMPSLWRYAHPDAKALIGVEWSRLANSPFGQQMRQKISAAATGEIKGLDVFNSIHRIFISSPGKLGARSRQQPPVVFAVQGDFDLKKIRKLVGDKVAGEETYRSVDILEGAKTGGRQMALALVSPQTLVIGDLGSVKAALDHQAAADPSQASNPLFLRASKLAATNDIWLVADAPPAAFSSSKTKRPSMLNDITGVDLGISLRSGLGLQLNLDTKSAKSAAKLATGLEVMTGMMLASLKSKPGAPELADKLKVSTEESTVNIALRMDQRELDQTLRQFGNSIASGFGRAAAGDVKVRARAGGAGQWSWGSMEQPPAPKPPRKQVIRIYGLDEGVREIPFSQ